MAASFWMFHPSGETRRVEHPKEIIWQIGVNQSIFTPVMKIFTQKHHHHILPTR
jgi:hypothetical protein